MSGPGADCVRHATAFFLGGRIHGVLKSADGLGLVPAALAPYRDLGALRHDSPLVLLECSESEPLASLTHVFADAVTRAEEGLGQPSERLPWVAARMERAIRRAVFEAGSGALSDLWNRAVPRAAEGAPQGFAECAETLRSQLPDAEIVGCDRDAPTKVVRHVWRFVQRRKAEVLRSRLELLALGLSGLLAADHAGSKAGRTPERLRAGFGAYESEQFDFQAMARVLATATPDEVLTPKRRSRIEGALSTLRNQGFVSLNGGGGARVDTFEFNSCFEALRAYRDRMPCALELAKAIAVAELEVTGAYRETQHDAVFDELGAGGLEGGELGFLPDSFVALDWSEASTEERSLLQEALTEGLPFKVVVTFHDLLERSLLDEGRVSLGIRACRVASGAAAGGGVFVLQTSMAGIHANRSALYRGCAAEGPALFSVYSGCSEGAKLPPYLMAAAASEARVFPVFSYDPLADPEQCARLKLDGNPSAELDWPQRELRFEDADLQAIRESAPFTLVDFAACDSRYDGRFALAPDATPSAFLTDVPSALDKLHDGMPENLPSVATIDDHDRLHRVIPVRELLREAARCREAWRALRGLARVRDARAEERLEADRAEIERRIRAELSETRSLQTVPQAGQEALASPPEAAMEPEPAAQAPPSDEPYIETPRCTTCNECTNINARMFAYNENKQAYIKDPDAGTFAQLVEAAESCQVAIIHPGKPRDPNEPGLDELIKRAEPFL